MVNQYQKRAKPGEMALRDPHFEAARTLPCTSLIANFLIRDIIATLKMFLGQKKEPDIYARQTPLLSLSGKMRIFCRFDDSPTFGRPSSHASSYFVNRR